MNNQQTTSPLQNRPGCYAKSPTVQDVFWPTPGLISCTGVTRRWGLLSHAQNAVCNPSARTKENIFPTFAISFWTTFHFSVVHKYIMFRLEVMSRLSNVKIIIVQVRNIKIGNVEIRNWISSILPLYRITQLLTCTKRLTRVHNNIVYPF